MTQAPVQEFVMSKRFGKNLLYTYTLNNNKKNDLDTFLKNNESTLQNLLLDVKKNTHQFKCNFTIKVTLAKQPDVETEHTVYKRSGQNLILIPTDIQPTIAKIIPDLSEKIAKHATLKSNLFVKRVDKLSVEISKYEPLKGGSYIDLPPYLKNKKCIINVKNKDDMCLRWAIRSALFPAKKDSDRPSSYPTDDGLDFTGVTFPTPVTDVGKVEKNNDLIINVFGYEDDRILPYHISKNYSLSKTCIDLLLITKDSNQHYTWIKKFNGLMYDQTKDVHAKHFCKRCLINHRSERTLIDHDAHCQSNNSARIILPKEGSTLKFCGFHKMLKVPYIVYADFESIIVSDDINLGFNTRGTHHHEACSYSYIIIRSDGTIEKMSSYRGPNAALKFLEDIRRAEIEIKDKLMKRSKKLIMRDDDEAQFQSQSVCHICKNELNDDRVRDHCHITGKYRGAAHNKCNFRLRINPKIPVFFHNLEKYDAHLIMQRIGEISTSEALNCIPHNTENYLAFNLGSLQFKDSYHFLQTSLDKLIKSITSFRISESYEKDSTKLQLLLQKGVYPYSFMDSFEKFELTDLPNKEEFYNHLSKQHITDEQYMHAKKVWDTFQCKNMGEYHDIYLKTDVLLLADAFENFRDVGLKNYELDPTHYVTLPSYSWDAMLKTTKIELDLIDENNYDMILFLERGIRGGISMVSERHATANNKYMPNFDATKESNYIIYLDANNLYGGAMSQSLPTGEFEWVTNDQELDTIMTHPLDSEIGYIVEVDLDYPSNIHDAHNDYPLAPESLHIKEEWLSAKQKELLGNRKYLLNINKLTPNLFHKKKYVTHYRNLQFYVSQGLVLRKIHRALKFKQSEWLKTYIDLNTKLRTESHTDFEKDMFKLMNNSVFGKTMENIRNRVNVELIRRNNTKDLARLRKLVNSPRYDRNVIFNDNMTAVHIKRKEYKFNKPIYLGMCILDNSKLTMYEFYYNNLKTKYNNDVKLLYTDTDSLLLDIKGDDFYMDMLKDSDAYDTSNYPSDHALFSNKNKKIVNKMKDEMGGEIITEFIGLRPKMYSIQTTSREIKRSKGVKKSVVENEIMHGDYKTTLETDQIQRRDIHLLNSKNHNIYQITTNKVSLSSLDTKRYMNGIHTYAYGHYKI